MTREALDAFYNRRVSARAAATSHEAAAVEAATTPLPPRRSPRTAAAESDELDDEVDKLQLAQAALGPNLSDPAISLWRQELRLNYLQFSFGVAYATHFDPLRALREAGYARPSVEAAAVLLGKPKVQEFVARLATLCNAGKDYVRARLKLMAETSRSEALRLRALETLSKVDGLIQPAGSTYVDARQVINVGSLVRELRLAESQGVDLLSAPPLKRLTTVEPPATVVVVEESRP